MPIMRRKKSIAIAVALLYLVFIGSDSSFAAISQPQRKMMNAESLLDAMEKEIVQRNQKTPKAEQLKLVRDKKNPDDLLLLTIQYKGEEWFGRQNEKGFVKFGGTSKGFNGNLTTLYVSAQTQPRREGIQKLSESHIYAQRFLSDILFVLYLSSEELIQARKTRDTVIEQFKAGNSTGKGVDLTFKGMMISFHANPNMYMEAWGTRWQFIDMFIRFVEN